MAVFLFVTFFAAPPAAALDGDLVAFGLVALEPAFLAGDFLIPLVVDFLVALDFVVLLTGALAIKKDENQHDDD